MHMLSEDVVGGRVDKCFMCGFTGVLLAVNLDRSFGVFAVRWGRGPMLDDKRSLQSCFWRGLASLEKVQAA